MLIVLDPSSEVPLYQQITDELKAQILAGELKPGESLPSVRQLAANLTTSVITTRRAYRELETQGLVQSQRGRGTFVTDLSITSKRKLGLEEVGQKLQDLVSRAARLGLSALALRQLLEEAMKGEGLDE